MGTGTEAPRQGAGATEREPEERGDPGNRGAAEARGAAGTGAFELSADGQTGSLGRKDGGEVTRDGVEV